jgi:hypothetical protein
MIGRKKAQTTQKDDSGLLRTLRLFAANLRPIPTDVGRDRSRLSVGG